MLHIKNIYLENGIPKIGEPVPMNDKLELALQNKQEVPDFYHAQFKADPKKSREDFDTYSLGVLLYKLMYTEYPIFPDNKVHIPTVPSYSKKLKTTLEILLNEGGSLKAVETKIEINENVKNQVKENNAKLSHQNAKMERQISVETTKRTLVEDMAETEDNFHQEQHSSHKSEDNDHSPDD